MSTERQIKFADHIPPLDVQVFRVLMAFSTKGQRQAADHLPSIAAHTSFSRISPGYAWWNVVVRLVCRMFERFSFFLDLFGLHSLGINEHPMRDKLMIFDRKLIKIS